MKTNLSTAQLAIERAAALCHREEPRPGFGITSSSLLCSQELTFTSVCARALDRFFFDDEHVNLGACLHQDPVRKKEQTPGNPEAADIYVMQLLSDEPGTPVLVADIKLNDHKHAIMETSLYAAACVTLWHEDDTCPHTHTQTQLACIQ